MRRLTRKFAGRSVTLCWLSATRSVQQSGADAQINGVQGRGFSAVAWTDQAVQPGRRRPVEARDAAEIPNLDKPDAPLCCTDRGAESQPLFGKRSSAVAGQGCVT